jgi:alanyl-tRNA synthetase
MPASLKVSLYRSSPLSSHTGSATVHSLFGSETLKWELGRSNVAVDFSRADEFTTAELEIIEREMNSHIRSAFPISATVSPRDALDSLPQLRGAPKGVAAELNELRIITIAGYDSNPCGGTHLTSTAEIQMFKLITQEKDRGAIRLRFLSGQRVFKALSASLLTETELSRLLCIQPLEIVSTVTSLFVDKREMSKQIKALQDELAVSYAQELVSLWSQPQSQQQLKSYIIQHRPGASLPFLQLAAETISQINEARSLGIQAIFLSGSDVVSDAASTSSASANKKKKSKGPAAPLPPTEFSLVIPSAPQAGSFIFYSTSAIVDQLKDRISSLLEGKAGGRPGKLQGQALALQNIAGVDELLSQSLGPSDVPT